MPTSLPDSLLPLAMLVFMLGIKHGFDADHLAMIDGMTRLNAARGRGFARYCGTLFSLGHGAVVVLIALGIGIAGARARTPLWLETSGGWISVLFLAGLGLLNLHAVFAAAPDEVVAPVGLKGRFLGRLAAADSPILVALVGALFALSFDTVAQAGLFAVAASQNGSAAAVPVLAAADAGARGAMAADWSALLRTLLLGLLFLAGMLVTDTVNGLWVSRLIARSDQLARVASRVLSLAVAGVTLLVAGFGAAQLLMPAVARWSDGLGLAFSAAVIGIVFASFIAGRALAGRKSRPGSIKAASRTPSRASRTVDPR
jgi:high-affinity nickel-transport protein